MDVSGRKQKIIHGSVGSGSDEVFDKYQPCHTIGHNVEAYRYCVTCKYYLCKTCYDYHKTNQDSLNHHFREEDGSEYVFATKQPNNECKERCQFHQEEVINFVCPVHDELGCTVCMTLHHTTCKNEYISEKCKGIAVDKAFDDIIRNLVEKLNEAEEVSEKACSLSNIMSENSDKVVRRIELFRKEINERLEQMQQEILKREEEMKCNNIATVQKVNDTCEQIISDVKNRQSSLDANKSSGNNAQLFIDIKRAEAALQSYQMDIAKDQITNANMRYSFRENTDLTTLLAEKNIFGELVRHIDNMIRKEDVNIKTEYDTKDCDITGCAVLSAGKLIVADNRNTKVKVVSLENKRVLKEKLLDSKPWDIAVLKPDRFAVTMPLIREIAVIKTDEKLSRDHSIKVDGKCYGIHFYRDALYVACSDPPCVVVLNTHGDILKTMPMNFLPKRASPYVTVGKDSRCMYINDFTRNSVVSVSLQGIASAAYTHGDLQGPLGMLVCNDGTLLVCCKERVYQVEKDLERGKMMHKEKAHLNSICYCTHTEEIYVGCLGNSLKVFSTH